MPVLDSIRDLQTRSLDSVKTAQEQVVSLNERMADTMLAAMPDVETPFAQYLPKPSEVVGAYFSFVNELHEANKDFASRLTSAWERGETTEDAD